MEIHFKTLLQLVVEHEFHAGLASDDLVPVALGGDPAWFVGRLLGRVRDGRLILLAETDADGKLLGAAAGLTLWFVLQARQPNFANYTAPPVAAGYLPLYRNAADPLAFDPPLAVRLVNARQRIDAGLAGRPLTLRWHRLNAGGEQQVLEQQLKNGETEALFATTDWPNGLYRLDQLADGAPQSSYWVKQPALGSDTPWGLLALTLDPALLALAEPPDLTLALAARRERLSYYVVAPDLLPGEFNQLQLLDTASQPLAFERIEAVDIALDDPLGRGLASEVSQLALFRSLAEVPRLAGGYPRLQLRRGTDVLVQHLPQPGYDRTQAQFVIHLAKS